MHEHVTLVRPDGADPSARGSPRRFPADLLGQSAARLRILALLYAFVFFMAGIFPMLVVPADRAMLVEELRPLGPERHRDRRRVAGRGGDTPRIRCPP